MKYKSLEMQSYDRVSLITGVTGEQPTVKEVGNTLLPEKVYGQPLHEIKTMKCYEMMRVHGI